MAVERVTRPQPKGKLVGASNRFVSSATGAGEIAQPIPLPGVKREEKVRKPIIGTKTRIALATLLAAEGVGAVVNERINDHDQPVSVHAKIVEDLKWPLSLAAYGLEMFRGKEAPVSVSPIFDNTADKGTITAANSIIIDSLDAIKDIPTIPPGDNPKHDIYILVPFQDISSEKINYSKNFLGDAQPLRYGSETKYAKERNVKDNIEFKDVLKDTVILAPADGRLRFAKILAPEGAVDAITLIHKGHDGKAYQLMLGLNVGFFKPLLIEVEPFLIDPERLKWIAQNINPAEREKLEQDFWVDVKRGQPIATTLQAANLSISNQVWPSGEFGKERIDSPIYPGNIAFITISSQTEQAKITILGK